MKFVNMPLCDLRSYNSPEAARKIEQVKNVAVLLLPQDMDAQTAEAFSEIKMTNVAATVHCSEQARVTSCNGRTMLSDANLAAGENIVVVNGTVWILPISENKHISLVVNGVAYYDKSSTGIEFIAVNGRTVPLDLRGVTILSGTTVLTAEAFPADGENGYASDGAVLVSSLPKTAAGRVVARTILADYSVRESGVSLEAESVLYATVGTDVLVKSDLADFRISETLLESLTGQLALMNVGMVRIDKKVSPALLREKVLCMDSIGTVRATKATFDIVQLLCHDVGTITRK